MPESLPESLIDLKGVTRVRHSPPPWPSDGERGQGRVAQANAAGSRSAETVEDNKELRPLSFSNDVGSRHFTLFRASFCEPEARMNR